MIKILPNENFVEIKLRKSWSRKPKAFSISILTGNPSKLNQSLISVTSEFNPPLSLINLFFTEAVCCGQINVGKTAFNLFEIALGKVFVSTFNNEIGLQFFKFCLSLSFFLSWSMSLITARF